MGGIKGCCQLALAICLSRGPELITDTFEARNEIKINILAAFVNRVMIKKNTS